MMMEGNAGQGGTVPVSTSGKESLFWADRPPGAAGGGRGNAVGVESESDFNWERNPGMQSGSMTEASGWESLGMVACGWNPLGHTVSNGLRTPSPGLCMTCV
jgi:hypothetical protein